VRDDRRPLSSAQRSSPSSQRTLSVLAARGHPDLEYLWIDLERIVEAAKYEGVLRQAAFGPTRQTVGDGTLAVIGLVAMRQPHHAFAVENGNAKKPLRSGQLKRRGKSNAILVPPLGPNLAQTV
jgi:hypothetical protein